MSDFDPHIAFGLLAQTVALKARTDQLRQVDQLKLATGFFAWVRDDASAAEALAEFFALLQSDPAVAGSRLQDWVQVYAHGLAPLDLEQRLSDVSANYDWQERADLR